VDHFSGGFLALRPGGLTVQVRKYVRDDGKTIQLVPMAHIGEADFYRKVAETFPTNSIILMEGVTDWKRLITNEASYKRAAKSLGLAEQEEEFTPTRGEMVMRTWMSQSSQRIPSGSSTWSCSFIPRG
jgi:hypothetical protein